MGSRIASSGGMMSPSTNVAASWQQRQQSTKDMLSALKSGDLQAAQTAFATIKASTPNLNGNTALQHIGQSLEAGDLPAAQKAAQDMVAAHHGHHHQQVAQNAKQVITSPVPASSPSSASLLLGLGSQINTFV